MSVIAFKQTPHRRAIAREAQRRSRQRVKKHQALAKVIYDGRVLEMLIRRLYIDEHEAGDAAAIGEAISLLLADSAAADL
jgi:hypothetical protein